MAVNQLKLSNICYLLKLAWNYGIGDGVLMAVNKFKLLNICCLLKIAWYWRWGIDGSKLAQAIKYLLSTEVSMEFKLAQAIKYLLSTEVRMELWNWRWGIDGSK